MSFREYIQKRTVRDNPAGDFVGDAKRDPNLPDATSWDQLEAYLTRKGAIPDAVRAAKTVWQSYRSMQRKAKA
ncbi:MAG: YozE family protein [Pseudorhodoplanes sp.]